MSKIIATKEAVFEAADKIWHGGYMPTQEKIRNSLGGGSYSTINNYLKEWKTSDENREYQNLSEQIPSAISEMGLVLGKELAARAYRAGLANSRQQETDEVIKGLEQEIKELKEENMRIQTLEAKVEIMETKYTELLKQNAEINKKNGWLEKEVQELRRQSQNK